MIICIAGTPGTGKTETAKKLAGMIDARLISLNKLVEQGKIKGKYDGKRRTRIVTSAEIRKIVKKEIDKKRINIIEGHLSYLIVSGLLIVLRTRPDILEKRMREKKWSRRKIAENLRAEILDAITIESMKKKRRIIEIDNTRMAAKQTARTIKSTLNNLRLQKKYRPGKIDWSERFFSYLIKD